MRVAHGLERHGEAVGAARLLLGGRGAVCLLRRAGGGESEAFVALHGNRLAGRLLLLLRCCLTRCAQLRKEACGGSGEL